MQHNGITITERVIAVASYLTFGLIGILWLIVNTLLLKKTMSKYLIYNVAQSCVISILFAIFQIAYGIFIEIFVGLPLLGKLFYKGHVFLFSTPIFSSMSLFNYIVMLFICYLSVVAIFGNLPKVPYITNMIKGMF